MLFILLIRKNEVGQGTPDWYSSYYWKGNILINSDVLNNPDTSLLNSLGALWWERGFHVHDISLQRILYGVKWIISYQVNLSIYKPAVQITFEFSCNHEWSFIFYLFKLFIHVKNMLKFCQYLNKTQQFKTTKSFVFFFKRKLNYLILNYLMLKFREIPSELLNAVIIPHHQLKVPKRDVSYLYPLV